MTSGLQGMKGTATGPVLCLQVLHDDGAIENFFVQRMSIGSGDGDTVVISQVKPAAALVTGNTEQGFKVKTNDPGVLIWDENRKTFAAEVALEPQTAFRIGSAVFRCFHPEPLPGSESAALPSCPLCGAGKTGAEPGLCPQCGAELFWTEAETWRGWMPVRLGEFRLVRFVGCGGMGVVFKALDRDNTTVAVKTVVLAGGDGSRLRRFQQEVAVIENLPPHPNIVMPRGHGIENGRLGWLAMEWVEGSPLSERIAQAGRQGLSVRETAGIVQQLLSGLSHLHEHGIIHRDLKPSNIFLKRDGGVKIGDFGIARAVSAWSAGTMTGLTMTGHVTGTERYMSPEQREGEDLTPASDVYSLGLIWQEMITGRATGGLIRIERDDCPAEWAEMITRMLELEPEKRLRLSQNSGETSPPETRAEATTGYAHSAPSHQQSPQIAPETQPEPANNVASKPGTDPVASEHKTASAPKKSKIGCYSVFIHACAFLLAGLSILFFLSKLLLSCQGPDSVPEPPRPTPAARPSPAPPQATPLPNSQPTTSVSGSPSSNPLEPDPTFINSLGLEFIRLPNVDHFLYVCRTETRVRDFELFFQKTGYSAERGVWSLNAGTYSNNNGHFWQSPGFYQTIDHPVTGVSWEDAKAFCKWLTLKERGEGRIDLSKTYRLPKDLEWSAAVGLLDWGKSPRERSERARYSALCPWGTAWPPPPNEGNFAGEETSGLGGFSGAIRGYRDNHIWTARVGSYKPNNNGLFDLAGNVWEWCEDLYDPNRSERVLRGGSFFNGNRDYLLSSKRHAEFPSTRTVFYGFRIVLAPASPDSDGY